MTNLSPFDIQARPNRLLAQALSCVLFVVCIGLYMHTSVARHRENAEDRVVPSGHQLVAGIRSAVLEPAEEDDYIPADNASTWERLRHSMIWKDTASSGGRFFISLALLIPFVVLAVHIGLFPWFGAGFLRFFLFFDKIVALSLLPILFIAFGIDQWSKIALIVIGVAIWTTKIPMLHHGGGVWAMLHEARADFSMVLGLLFLMTVGPGAWSVSKS